MFTPPLCISLPAQNDFFQSPVSGFIRQGQIEEQQIRQVRLASLDALLGSVGHSQHFHTSHRFDREAEHLLKKHMVLHDHTTQPHNCENWLGRQCKILIFFRIREIGRFRKRAPAAIPRSGYLSKPALLPQGAPARQRARSQKVGMARRRRPTSAARAAFASRDGACAPEAWDPGGAASLPFFTRCCRTHPRGSALVPPTVGMARRRRPIFAATPPLHPETAHARLKLGTPTARRPYLFSQGAFAPPARQRARSTQGRDGAPSPSDLRGASRLCIPETAPAFHQPHPHLQNPHFWVLRVFPHFADSFPSQR